MLKNEAVGDIHNGAGQDPQTNAQHRRWGWASSGTKRAREETAWDGSSEGVEKALDEPIEIQIGASHGLDLSD